VISKLSSLSSGQLQNTDKARVAYKDIPVKECAGTHRCVECRGQFYLLRPL
jgi:hypothetical protein